MSDMSFFAKFSSRLYLNEKVQEFAEEYPRAAFLWVNAITYCVDRQTDGVFNSFIARRFLNAHEEDLQALVDANLLEIIGENEYLIHDYDQAQVTSTKRDELRAKRAAAGRKGGIHSPKSRGSRGDSVEANAKQMLKQKLSKREANAQANAQAKIKQKEADNRYKIIDNIYINNNNTNNVINGDEQENQTPEPTTELTPEPTTEHTSEDLTVSSQALSASSTQTVERITQALRDIYPAERYDADSTHCQFMLENAVPRIRKTAGIQDPVTWFINRTRAYIEATERRYVKKFSRYIDQQVYLQDWAQAIPQSAQPVNRSQAGLQHNVNLAQYYEARGD